MLRATLTKSKRAVTENRREAEERAEQRGRGAAEQRSRRGSRSLLLRESRGGKEREEEEEGAGEEGQTRWLLGWVSETESESNIIGDSLRDSCWELGEVLR